MDARTHNTRGKGHFQNDQLLMALSEFNEGLRLDPDAAYMLSNRGIINLHLGRIDEALQDFNRAIEIDPDLVHAYVNRSYVYFSSALLCGQEWLALAQRDYEKALSVDSGKANIYLHQLIITIMRRQLEFSTTILQESLEAFNKTAEIYFTCGLRVLEQNNKNKAKHYFFRVLQESGAPMVMRLYSSLQLYRLGEIIDLAPPFHELKAKADKTVEELCVLALTHAESRQDDFVKECLSALIPRLKLAALPDYLRKEFLKLAIDPRYFVNLTNQLRALVEPDAIKGIFKILILNCKDQQIFVNASLQSFCARTTLGGIFAVPRPYVVNLPLLPTFTLFKGEASMTSGSLGEIASYLNMRAADNLDRHLIQDATFDAIQTERERNPLFYQKMQTSCPQCYAWLTGGGKAMEVEMVQFTH